MAGIYFQSPEPDLSSFQYQYNIEINCVGNSIDDVVGQKSGRATGSSLLPWALIVSLGIHAVVLSLKFTAMEKQRVSEPTRSIQIELRQAPPIPLLQPEAIESTVVEPIAIETVEATPTELHTDTDKKTKTIEPKTVVDEINEPQVFIPITPEELRSLQDQPTYPLEPGDADLKEVSPLPFGSVFDPRLRARLQAAQTHSKAGDPEERVQETAQGMKVFKISDRHCLMTVPEFRQQSDTNWYHTLCKGKTESEQMMDRVKESLRHK